MAIRTKFSVLLLLGALALWPTTATSQETKWLLGIGPSEAVDAGRVALGPNGPLAGASASGRHAMLGMERRLGQSAVDLRVELTGNEFSSHFATYLATDVYSRVRAATRDRSGSLSLGAIFRARREARWSPYMLGTLGYMYSALGTDPNDQSHAVTQETVRHGIGLAMGAGLNVRLGGRELFLEARRFAKSTPGSSYIPITLGLRF